MSKENEPPRHRRRINTPGAHPLPEDWQPNRRLLQRLSNKINVPPDQIKQQYEEPFKNHSRERSFLYRNWDTAFTMCVVKDWFNYRGK